MNAPPAYRHWFYRPADTPAAEGWPLIVFLHGVGERGEDLDRVANLGPPHSARLWPYFPFAVAAPQCPAGQYWSPPRLLQFIDALCAAHPVDPDRLYLTGLSMGGYATWQLALEQPYRFAAIAPVCGGGDPQRAARLRHLPVWAFHGDQDPVVPLAASRAMVTALERCGAPVRFTVYPGGGHDAWTRTYADWELYRWFLDQRRARVAAPR